MNKFIKRELEKCRIAQIPPFDDDTTDIYIQRDVDGLHNAELIVGHYYLIELSDSIIHPTENSTLATNWNNGLIPQSKHLKCAITQIMGKMIKVDGSGFNKQVNKDLNDVYMGLWLPRNGVKVLYELK